MDPAASRTCPCRDGEAQDPIALGKHVELRIPHAPVGDARMDEDDRLPGACDLIIDLRAVDLYKSCLGCAHGFSLSRLQSSPYCLLFRATGSISGKKSSQPDATLLNVSHGRAKNTRAYHSDLPASGIIASG